MLQLIDMEREHAFSESDIRLLQTLANSMSVALENARLFDETQRLLKETEQRAAELAVINSVQEGMAAELDFQAIIDLVGDKIREIFGDAGIRIIDPKTDMIHYPYAYEHGQADQHRCPARFAATGFGRHIFRTRETLVINENMEQASRIRQCELPGSKLEKSAVFVPLIAGDRCAA